ncbi:MAG: hypothetical protein GX751_05755, partial [Desulfuromonadaceae bacterium]|nr:hypothetical protein [Desulfuromonadaceae bacterium]
MMIFLRRSVLILTFLGVALLMVMDVVLPRYLEKRLPAWAAESGFPGLHCEVRRVGLSGADLGQVVLGEDSDRPVLRCASVQISYTPSGLLNKTVENVHVGGLSLTLFRSEAGWQAQGLPFGAASSNGLAGENSDFQLPLHVKGVTLSASEVIFVDKASVFRLPVELQARMPTQERIDGTMVLSPFGDPVRLAAAVDLAEKSVSGRVGAARLPLRHLAALLDFPCDLLPSGRAGFEASFDVGLAPFRVRAGDGRFVLHNPHWEKAGLAWTGDDPFVVQAALEGEKVRINMTPITFEGPVSGVLDMKDAMVEITPHPRFSGLWSL